MSEDEAAFYLAFEDKERGSRSLILERLAVYLPLVEQVRKNTDLPVAIDIGCGRGEWLELLQSREFTATGVDMDAGMLSACHDRNLDVIQAEGVGWLSEQTSESIDVISAFHVAEHLPFEQLQTLVLEALRVLRPGGLLILETPNPENLSVGSHTFYLDPTHERPIPPALLSFLPAFYGYDRSVIWRLQQRGDYSESTAPTLNQVLTDVSPDYAVIAQKTADSELMQDFDEVLSVEHGIDLHTLTSRYDQSVEQRAEAVSLQISELKGWVSEFAQYKKELESDVAELKSSFFHYKTMLESIHASHLWRLLYPFKWIGLQRRLLRTHGAASRFKALLKKLARPVVGGIDRLIRRSPRSKQLLLKVAHKSGMHGRLKRLYQAVRREQAAERHNKRHYSLSETQRLTQSTWLPPERALSVDELMRRIEDEIAMGNRGKG